MINDKKVVVVLPAYNAAKTLEITYNEVDFTFVDTIKEAQKLGIRHIDEYQGNKGYIGNQKSFDIRSLEPGINMFCYFIMNLH